MAAYAALVSLMHITDQILVQGRHSISLDKQQIESLREKIRFFQDFLENCSNGDDAEVAGLEHQITTIAYKAEDIIESYIVDQINVLAGFCRGQEIKKSSKILFGQSLQKVMKHMNIIKKIIIKLEKQKGIKLHEQPIISPAVYSSKSTPPTEKNAIVGLDDVLIQIMDRLMGQSATRQIIPVVGMGGIGKTTLTRSLYDNPSIVQYFHVRSWLTISQKYSEVRSILLEALFSQKRDEVFAGDVSRMSDHELGHQLYKSLSGRRYLIVLDDMWSLELWNELRYFFPDNKNGSRIIVTTRLLSMVSGFGSNCVPYEMKLLNEQTSWKLLCKKVFGQENCCPLELNEGGRKIAKNCKGLPLSIVVIAGLLAKSDLTQSYWEYVAEHVSSIVESEDDGQCLRILSVSYNHLPVHLKPCFLYMGVFPEDHEIRVSQLIKLWVAEGFLKPVGKKDLEEVAEEYLKDLIDRNLILIHRRGSIGKMKTCKVHDLVRKLCLRESQEEKFYFVTGMHGLEAPKQMTNSQVRRVVIHQSMFNEKYRALVLHALGSMPLIRSLICNFPEDSPHLTFRLLRVLNVVDEFPLRQIVQLINSRYLNFRSHWILNAEFPSSIHLLWNLQTLIVKEFIGVLPCEIWEMPHLRHIEFDKEVYLPDPQGGQRDNQHTNCVLKNLQTIFTIKDFKCSGDILRRIPNIKKLRISYDDFSGASGTTGSRHCLINLGDLRRLDSLTCFFHGLPSRHDLLRNLKFPCSLKKLTLSYSCFYWEDMTIIGSLPHLEVLKLKIGSFMGHEWTTIDGEFLHLKFLLIESCHLVQWNTDCSHFPCLEHLVLRHMYALEEIPLGIGEIPTLQSIELTCCSDSAIISAKKILEELESFGIEGLQVKVWCQKIKTWLAGLVSENFQFHILTGYTRAMDMYLINSSSKEGI